ncbi:winged helix-turn-helix transcriptional regulator [Bacillus sp. ISL-40]|uniref:ArsR/SmtB family transcription factor n=1 Tax=unclassified Bacillus (in: firmicutes) TaxID=185979 RepID=UPI001BECB2CF|nr:MULTISPECIES: metalloregulator ArsR/SmtB family transcription factor [unclassified Bacillus (in: firmicutes)]MBT2700382.1 winged helix-turn-helix transcriptional regulator [Bacillus sp. ISL-40]MBT2722268.1 winged helix-turn-helix transcriptional regulator [Bacillus sp. ISL-46]MBT2742415.1 winged helix-turn-helix transcriptional regulator [Bacillus sp. ISL-77]
MKPVEIFKALGNDTRLQILVWLKEPEKHFSPQPEEVSDLKKSGVCVTQFHQKLNISQSTASQHLSILHRAGLVKTERHGKFTYYKRNEEAFQRIKEMIGKEI